MKSIKPKGNAMTRLKALGATLAIAGAVGCAVLVSIGYARDAAGDQAGHDHAAHGDEGHGHDGHDHAAHGDEGHGHEGHDHAAHGDEGHGHEGHDHAAHGEEGDDHDGHAHGDHDHSHDHGSGGVVLGEQARRLIGLELDTAKYRIIDRTIVLPGRVDYNRDRLAHVTPRFGGVIREVPARIGQWVRAGQTLAVIESNASLTRYKVTAPFAGRIIEKHASLGEFVSEERQLFLVANLSTVWVDCDVYASDIDRVRAGMEVVVEAVGTERTRKATVMYVSPVFNPSGGTGLVRIKLDNRDGVWRPGMFIRARLRYPTSDSVLTVATDAIQALDGESVVFTPASGNAFANTLVTTGVTTPSYTHIVNGLEAGDLYVSRGAFELKATIVTSNMDPHAGHGH
jgi:cobalt-zinc-cadmium efflux system membrane fusion protein